MRGIGRKLVAVAAVLIVATAVGAVSAVGQGTRVDPPRGNCTASAKPRGGDFNVKVDLRCDFKVMVVSLATTKKITRIAKQPSLKPAPTNGAALQCERLRDRHARCKHAELPSNTRIVEALRVKPGPCKTPRLQVDLTVRGGLDCGNDPCPAIGLNWKKSMTVSC